MIYHQILLPTALCLLLLIGKDQAVPLINQNPSLASQIEGDTSYLSAQIENLATDQRTKLMPRKFMKRQSSAAVKAAQELQAQVQAVNRDLETIRAQNGRNARLVRLAAKDAINQEKKEDVSRSVLASQAPPQARQAVAAALQSVQDNGPSKVVAGFKQIEKSPANVVSNNQALQLIDAGRVPVKAANNALIALAGVQGGPQGMGVASGGRGFRNRSRRDSRIQSN